MAQSHSEFQASSVTDINDAVIPGKSTMSFIEIPVLDGERAVAFYSAVLGWEFHPDYSGMPSHSISNSAAKRVWCFSVGHRVLGALHEVDPEYAVTLDLEPGSKKLVMRTSWNVDDIDETTAKVLANGGKVHFNKATIYEGKFGHSAHYVDTEGNLFGVWTLPK